MSEILLCLAIMFSAKLVLNGAVAQSSDTVQICNGNVRRKQEAIVLAIVRQTFRVYLDQRSTVYEGQEGGLIDLIIEGEERRGSIEDGVWYARMEDTSAKLQLEGDA